MFFNSLDYLIFFPVVFMVYFVVPKRIRYGWLLVASFYFYACWNAKYTLLLLASILTTYASGLLIHTFRRKAKPGLCKLTVALCFLLNLSILGLFKYGNFFLENLNAVLHQVRLEQRIGALDIVMPVGISFYTFQALSYIIDVYRGNIDAEKNVAMYSLFVSFFPQLLAGPIGRSKNLLPQLRQPRDFDAEKAGKGLRTILWGLFLKMVIADNLTIPVHMVFGNYGAYDGIDILLSTTLFAIQLYCDFAGYSFIAIGSAQILGYDLMENFTSPYLSASVGEFWRRWHISLGSWFRDYVYVPISSRLLKRKWSMRPIYIVASMVVWLLTGLWHGADWTFVFWGLLNGALIVLGEMTKTLRTKALDVLHVRRDTFSYQFFRRALTFFLINLTWIYFRASRLADANRMVIKVFTQLNLRKMLTSNFWEVFLSMQTMAVLFFSFSLLAAFDGMRYRGVNPIEWLGRQNALFRYLLYGLLIVMILAFGVYGHEVTQSQFIYFQF